MVLRILLLSLLAALPASSGLDVDLMKDCGWKATMCGRWETGIKLHARPGSGTNGHDCALAVEVSAYLYLIYLKREGQRMAAQSFVHLFLQKGICGKTRLTCSEFVLGQSTGCFKNYLEVDGRRQG